MYAIKKNIYIYIDIYPIATLRFSTKWTVVFLLIMNFLIASFLPTQNRKRPHMYLELTMF